MDLVSQNLLLTAGGGKKDPTYVDDVFSTDLYRGSSVSGSGPAQIISNGLKFSNANAGNSVFFDGSGDNLLVGSSSEFTMTGDFTMECWFRPTQVSGVNVILNGRGNAGSGGPVIYINGTTLVFDNGTGSVCSQASAVVVDTWYHVAGTRYGNTWTLYKNGTSVATGSDSTSYSSAVGFYIGQSHHGNEDYNGSISNVRITNGQVIYSGNFTPSTKALTTTSQGATASNVKLLCCQSSLSSTVATKSPTTIVESGNVKAQAFGPFTGTDGEGGLVWLKSRTANNENALTDTVTGAGKRLQSESNTSQSTSTESVSGFTNSGFTLPGGWNPMVNAGNQEYASWSFRKAPGFFDVVTYTGDGASSKTISHSLGSIPGVIMVKRTDAVGNWVVYHTRLGNDKILYLDTADSAPTNMDQFDKTDPTASTFTVEHTGSGGNDINVNNATYVAYLFAGGASTAATARSVQLDGSGDWFTTSTSSDYTFGTGDFTVEHWINLNGSASGQPTILDARTTGSYTTQWVTYFDTDYTYNFYALGANRLKTSKLARNTWNHIALVRSSGVTRLYLNGTSEGAYADTNNYSMTSIVFGANAVNFGHNTNGRLSNLRVVKGTAVYTSSFKPPTEPLKNITNTKLLCFNNSSTTGTTVGTITASGDPTAITDSPFDDPEGFKFGEEGDQNIIKCGTYKALGGTWNLNLGWEPQWILIKNDGNQNWTLVDAIRGMAWDDVSQGTGYDEQLHPNTNDPENNRNICDAIPNGIRISSVEDIVNGGSQNYYYIAIRRPDGYVGKPIEDATKVFAIDAGNGSNDIPVFDSGFPVDFQFLAKPAQSGVGRYVASRLMGPREVLTNTTQVEGAASNNTFDSMYGWRKGGSNSTFTSWMWKRHAGFDVITYTGNGLANHDIPHSLNQVPDMIWIKPRDEVLGWMCGHSGLNGGVNPWDWYFYLNYPWASTDSPSWNDQAPTSTHFSVNGTGHGHNNNGQDYVAFLWSNVTGISKAGYYTGNGSTQTITTGFQPRFLWLMKDDGSGGRYVFDTFRGWTSGNDYYVQLETTDAQGTADIGAPISTGFTLTSNAISNANTSKYIYYAHA